MDLALDDIIKQNKTPRRSGARGRASGNRGSRRVNGGRREGGNFRSPAPFPARSRNVPDGKWTHDRFEDDFEDTIYSLRSPSNVNATTKILISNLDFGVTDGDINELFSEFGPLRRAAVHYDKSGRSLGSSDVVFERRSDAMRAMKQYNGVPLDGRAMKITIVGDETRTQTAAAVTRSTAFGTNRMRGMNDRSSGGRTTIPRGGTGGGRRGGGGATRGRFGGRRGGGSSKPPMSAEQLDADLDAYINKME